MKYPQIFLLAATLATHGATHGEVIDIAWGDGPRVDRTLTLAPKMFVELCAPVGAGKSVSWSFDADHMLSFNIHYHVGKAVHYPNKVDDVQHLVGELIADERRDYCWMWSNKSATIAKLVVRLVLS